MKEERMTLAPQPSEALRESKHTTCCIVGAGPAGAVLALLLARQGIDVTLLQGHGDFDRQFRGDSIYPTVLEMMADLGLSEGLHKLPHTKLDRIPIETAQGEVTPINMRYIKSPYPYIMLVPQADFLQFVVTEANRYPNFHLILNAPVRELLETEGRVRGVRYRAPDGWYEVHAELTVGADGRFSKVRSLARIPLHSIPASMDNIWFRLPRQPGDPQASFGRMTSKTMVAMLMRTDHWQITCNIPKGSYPDVRAQGLPAFRRLVVEVMPILAQRMEEITEWNQLSLLSVEMGHVSRWYRPGLLLIGDAAHIMSPALGAGINLAIQDAIVAANVLTHPLQRVQQQGQALA
jgi:2-polyprenyl-6-methoxyphenol hydroxylase-like FAD-dependent oxidoreductase